MPKIDLVQLSFGLAKSSDSVFEQVSSRLKKLNDEARLKLDINDKDVKQQLSDVSKWMESFSERGLNLGNVTGDFLRSLTDSSRTFEQNAAALGKMYSQMKIISGFTDEELTALSKIESINWDKIFEGANKPSEAISKYLVDLDEAIAKFKELTKKGTKDSFAEAAKYFARISGLNGVGKIGLSSKELGDWNDALTKPQSGQYAIGRTAAATAREILEATKNAMSVIQADIVKANLDSYLREPHGGNGTGVSMDTTKLESAIKNLGSDISSHVDDAADKVSDAVNNLKQSIEDGIKVTETKEENPKETTTPAKKSKTKTKKQEQTEPQYSEELQKQIDASRVQSKQIVSLTKTIEEINKIYNDGPAKGVSGNYSVGFAGKNAAQQKAILGTLGLIHSYSLQNGNIDGLNTGAKSFYDAVIQNKGSAKDIIPLFEPLKIAIEQEVSKLKQTVKKPIKPSDESAATVEGEKPVGVTINASNAKEFFEELQKKADETPIEVTLTIKDRENFVAEVKKAANGDEQVSADPNGDKQQPRTDVPVTLTVSNPDDFYSAIQQNLNEREPITIKIKPAIDQNATEESPIKKYIVDAETAIKKILELKKAVTRGNDAPWTAENQNALEEQLKYYTRLQKLIPGWDAYSVTKFQNNQDILQMFEKLHKISSSEGSIRDYLQENQNAIAEINAIRKYDDHNPYADEIANLQLLQGTVAKVEYAVKQKTKAFEDERTVVDGVVKGEQTALNTLKGSIDDFVQSLQTSLTNQEFKLNVTADQQKLEDSINSAKIVYHYGNLDNGTVSHQFGDEFVSYVTGKRNGGRPWADGTGTYVTHDAGEFANGDYTDPLKYFYAIDTSKLKLFEAHTEETAKAFYEFQHKLEQYILTVATGTDLFKDELKDVDGGKLYQMFKEVFKSSSLTLQGFKNFVQQMIDLVHESGLTETGNSNPKALMEFKKKHGSADIKTRFMQMLGYEGTDLSGTSYDALRSGSVIYGNSSKDYVISKGQTIDEVKLEKQSVDELGKSIDGVEGAVNKKSEAFEDEQKRVNSAITAEIGDLDNLQKKLDDIGQSLRDTLTNYLNEENNRIPIKITVTDDDIIDFIASLQEKILLYSDTGIPINLDKSYIINQIYSAIKNTNFRIQLDSTVENAPIINGQKIVSGGSILDIFKQINEADLISVDKYGSRINLKERGMYFNSNTGVHTNPFVFDNTGSFTIEEQLLRRFDSTMTHAEDIIEKYFDSFFHSHPEYLIAPSTQDLKSYLYNKQYSGLTSQYILGLDEIAHFDLGVLNDFDIEKLIKFSSELDFRNSPLFEKYYNDTYSFSTLMNYLNHIEETSIFGSFVEKFGETLYSSLQSNDLAKYFHGDTFDKTLKPLLTSAGGRNILNYLSQDSIMRGNADVLDVYEAALSELVKKYINPDISGEKWVEVHDKIDELVATSFGSLGDEYSLAGYLKNTLTLMSDNRGYAWSAYAPEEARKSFDQWAFSQLVDFVSKISNPDGTPRYNVSDFVQKWSWDDFVKNDPMHLGSAVVQQMQQMAQGDQQNQNEQITPQVNFTEQAKQIAQTIKTEIEAALSGENQIPINVIISPDSLAKIREQLQAKFAESPFELNINQESLVKQIETALSSIDFVTQLQNMAVKNPDGTASVQAHQVLDAVNASESKTQEVGGKAIPVPVEGKVEDPAAFILSIQNQLTGQTVKVNISPNGTLDEFVSGVQTILGLIDNALPSQPIGVKIAPVTDQKQSTAEAVHYTTNADALQEETTKVSNLKIAVSYLKDMIDKKTEAIEHEASVMAESVLAEMVSLDSLKKKVIEVEDKIKILFGNEQNGHEIQLKLPQKLPKAEIQPDTKYFIEQLKEALKNAGLIVRVKAEVEKKVVEKKVVEKAKATNQTTSSQQVNSSQSTNNGAVNHLTLDDINALRDEAAIRRKQAEDERSQAIENNLEKQKNLYANIVKTKYEIDKLDKNRANLSQEELDDLEKLKTQLVEYQKQLIKTRKEFRLYNDPETNALLLSAYQTTKENVEIGIRSEEREKKEAAYDELVTANKESIDLYFEKLSKIRELAYEISTLQFKGEPTDELRKDLDKTIVEAEELRRSLEDIGIKDVQFSDPVVNRRIEVGVDKKGEPITAKPIEPYEGEYFRLQSKNDTHSQQYVDLVNKLGEKIDYINKHPLDIITSKEFAELESFIDYINSIEKSTKLTDPTRISKQSANFEQWVARNSRAAKTYKTEIEQIRSAYTEMQADHKKYGTNEYLKETISQFAKLQATAAREGNLGPSFFESWQKRVRGIATYLASFFSFYRVIGTIRNVISTVQQLNASMIEMSKTAGTSLSNIESEFQNFYKIAQETGGTIQDTITATTDWVRNGFDIPQAEELSRVAQIYKNVGYGVDINSANEYLISTLRGFNIEAENAISIVDKINEVGNNFPIDQKGIGEALQRSAASFAAANTDLSKSIALITAAKQYWQDI